MQPSRQAGRQAGRQKAAPAPPCLRYRQCCSNSLHARCMEKLCVPVGVSVCVCALLAKAQNCALVMAALQSRRLHDGLIRLSRKGTCHSPRSLAARSLGGAATCSPVPFPSTIASAFSHISIFDTASSHVTTVATGSQSYWIWIWTLHAHCSTGHGARGTGAGKKHASRQNARNTNMNAQV